MTTTVLAVDDSKTMRKVLEITFSGDTFKVLLAENAQQALEKIRSERPTLALIDANLGSAGGGYELCGQIKREAPGVGVLILSSKQQPYDKTRGASAGADEFMDKPFDTQQMVDKAGALARRLADAPPAAARSAPAAQAPAVPVAPAPSPRPPMVQARPAAPAIGLGAPRPHVQTLIGGQAAAPGAAPAPAPVAAPPPAATAAAVATSGNGEFAERLAGLGLSKDQVDGVLALSREVVEQVVWEVVPQLAETLIKEEIRRLTAE